ncbi:DUF1189 family protein [bacterium]|nr:DUF1189 family protein [bacterium]
MDFFRTILGLCTGFKGYRAVRDQSLGQSLSYLAGLVAVLAILVLAGRLIPTALERGAALAAWFDANAPVFRIEQGRLITEASEPQYVRTRDTLFVLDPTGQVTEPDAQAPQGVLVGPDQFTVWVTSTNGPQPQVYTQRQSLRGFPDGTVGGAYLLDLVHSLLWVGVPLALVMLVAAAGITCFVQAGFFALVAALMERSVPAPLQFRQLLNIALHAVTPAAILVTAYVLLHLEGLDLWLVYLVAYGIFLVGATSACRGYTTPVPPRQDNELL